MGTDAPWRALEAVGPEEAKAAPNRSRPSALLLMLAAAAALLVVSLAVAAFVELRPAGQVEVVSGTGGPSGPGGTASPAMVVVQVAGAVIRPGVYSLPAGSRVTDAIGAAGGYSTDVDPRGAETKINLAAKLQDAQLIVVPRRGDASSSSSGAAASAAPSGPLNLNIATAAQLDGLPGIGPATAAKIIASREQLPFATVDDLVTRKCQVSPTTSRPPTQPLAR
ncbi:MAG TPA: SLBB domain-containing protein [Candidatus Limnocylindrales bacterium]